MQITPEERDSMFLAMAAGVPGLALTSSAWSMGVYPVSIHHASGELWVLKGPFCFGSSQTLPGPISPAAMVQSLEPDSANTMHTGLQFVKGQCEEADNKQNVLCVCVCETAKAS